MASSKKTVAKVEEKIDLVNSYCVKIPLTLWAALEKKRKKLMHNKTAAVQIMSKLYIDMLDG